MSVGLPNGNHSNSYDPSCHSLRRVAKPFLNPHRLYFPIIKAARRGAFLAIAHQSADAIASQLRDLKIIVDAREGLIRICPDILTTEEELVEALAKLGDLMRRK